MIPLRQSEKAAGFFIFPVDKMKDRVYSECMNNHSYVQLKGSGAMALNDVEHCDFIHAHEELVRSVQKRMPDEDVLSDLAELYRVFGDSTRIRILYVLLEAEMCVCDIALLLGMSQSAISHQLRVLKQSKLVKNRRDGKTVFYSLADDHVRLIIRQGMEHVCE